jgi:phosphomannomutase
VDGGVAETYFQRWVDAFGEDALEGMKVGLYEHSAVGRDLLHRILVALGADVVRLGRSDQFVSVDTEAIRPEDVELARRWAKEHQLDAIVSTDGDSDRPLVSDERGEWLRGDVAGALAAKFLRADIVVTPVSCNTVAERCGAFERVVRTRIGSPFVIEAMLEAVAGGAERVVGYEGNGGFLTATDIPVGRRILPALPTRDPVVVALAVMVEANRLDAPVSDLPAGLPPRVTASDRLKEFPTELSEENLKRWKLGGPTVVAGELAGVLPDVVALDDTDGLRAAASNGEIVHVRPSGNAPELRCYVEADSAERARALMSAALEVLRAWRA